MYESFQFINYHSIFQATLIPLNHWFHNLLNSIDLLLYASFISFLNLIVIQNFVLEQHLNHATNYVLRIYRLIILHFI